LLVDDVFGTLIGVLLVEFELVGMVAAGLLDDVNAVDV
jgi:hypothetical protein